MRRCLISAAGLPSDITARSVVRLASPPSMATLPCHLAFSAWLPQDEIHPHESKSRTRAGPGRRPGVLLARARFLSTAASFRCPLPPLPRLRSARHLACLGGLRSRGRGLAELWETHGADHAGTELFGSRVSISGGGHGHRVGERVPRGTDKGPHRVSGANGRYAGYGR